MPPPRPPPRPFRPSRCRCSPAGSVRPRRHLRRRPTTKKALRPVGRPYLPRKGDADDERAAHALGASYLYLSVMHLDERLDHREPQTCAFDLGAPVGAVVPVEYVRDVLWGDAVPGVPDGYLETMRAAAVHRLTRAERDGASLGSVLYGVAYQVHDHARHLVPVRFDLRQPPRHIHAERHPFPGGQHVEPRQRVVYDVVRPYAPQVQLQHPGLYPRQVQVLLDHFEEPPAASLYR